MQWPETSDNSGFIQIKEALINRSVKNTVLHVTVFIAGDDLLTNWTCWFRGFNFNTVNNNSQRRIFQCNRHWHCFHHLIFSWPDVQHFKSSVHCGNSNQS